MKKKRISIYICPCGREHRSEEDARRCEKEYRKVPRPKFKVGDIVIVRGGEYFYAKARIISHHITSAWGSSYGGTPIYHENAYDVEQLGGNFSLEKDNVQERRMMPFSEETWNRLHFYSWKDDPRVKGLVGCYPRITCPKCGLTYSKAGSWWSPLGGSYCPRCGEG
jgi:hypothetical protein